MKKIVKRVLTVLAISAAFTVSVLAVTAYAAKDQILNSDISVIDQIASNEDIEQNDIDMIKTPSVDKRTIGQNMIFIHTIDKGDDLEVPLSWNSYKLADDTYFVDIVLNNGHGNPNYRIKNAELVINLDEKINILTSFYSDKGLEYTNPVIDLRDDLKKVKCNSQNGYMHLQMLLSGVQSESLSFDLKYAVAGNGIYSFNKFPQTWEGLEHELK